MLPTITISGNQLSDLFFNAEHPEFSAACELDGPYGDTARQAIQADAQNFCSYFNGSGILAIELAADFMKRL